MAAEKVREIFLLPQAQRDWDAIRKYSSRAAEEILEKIELLKLFPEMGPAMTQAYQGYRQLVCGHYRVIYEIISEKRIEIAYIRHGARSLLLRLVR